MGEMKDAGSCPIFGWYTNHNAVRSYLLECVILAIEKRIPRSPARRNKVGVATCPIRSYREIICLSGCLRQRPPGFRAGALYCEFRAIILVHPTFRSCAACSFRQVFASSAPVLGLFALSMPDQQFQLASHSWFLRGYHAKHNSFSSDSKLRANKIRNYGCDKPYTSKFRASDTLPCSLVSIHGSR